MNDKTNPLQKNAWDLYQGLQEALRNESKYFLIKGKILKDIRDTKSYRYLGEGGFDTFKDFLNNPEIGLNKPSTEYLYIRVYEFYIETLGLDENDVVKYPLNRLMRLLPQLRKLDPDKAKEQVEELMMMTNVDFYDEVKKRKLDPNRPKIIRDKDTGLYKIEFTREMVLSIKETALDVELLTDYDAYVERINAKK